MLKRLLKFIPGLFISILFVSSPVLAQTCKPSRNSCDFYFCQESQRSCGAHGYFQKFAIPYCQAFLGNQSRFSEKGQAWLRKVRLELMRRVDRLPTDTNCQQIKIKSFKDHIGAYTKTGFCEIPNMDRWRVARIMRGAFAEPLFLKTTFEIYNQCRTINPDFLGRHPSDLDQILFDGRD